MEGLGDLVREAVDAGFLNIDIDASTLVDLSLATIDEQQRVNAERTADLTRLVREVEPAEVTISVGGEIGEVGKTNSTEAELRAYLAEYRAALGRRWRHAGRSQQGQHPDRDVARWRGAARRSVAPVAIDFDTLTRLSTVAREEFGLAGCVQHGASTLPEEAFGHFPAAGCAEIHLATGFQNILYDGGGLPADLRAEMMAWCLANCADERKPGETDEQFLYKTRKKALGPFKEALWSIGPRPRPRSAPTSRPAGPVRAAGRGRHPRPGGPIRPAPGLPDRCRPALGGRRARPSAPAPKRSSTTDRSRPCPTCSASPSTCPTTRTIPHGGPISGTSATSWSAASPSSRAGDGRTDVKPIAGTDWCEYHHLGLVIGGVLHYITPEGLEMEVGPGMLYEILPSHDAWVVGDRRSSSSTSPDADLRPAGGRSERADAGDARLHRHRRLDRHRRARRPAAGRRCSPS